MNVMKEYYVNCHCTAKHSSKFDEILGPARDDKIENMKIPLKTARCFYQLKERFRTGCKTEFCVM